MYYETKHGEDELQAIYRSMQAKLAEDNEELDEEEPKAKNQRKYLKKRKIVFFLFT